MSFILEALKKSDQKRQDGTVPSLGTVHRSAPVPGGKRAKWIWALLLVLALNAGVLLWLFGPWQQEKRALPEKIQVPAAAKMPAEAPPAPASADPKIVPVAPPRPAPVAMNPAPTEPEVRKPPVIAQPVKQKQTASIPAETRPKRIYALGDLPSTIRSEIPELHMSLHAFNPDSSAASLIRVSGQIMREGDQLDGKFLLEKITAEGAIFRFQGYEFLLPRKG